MNRDVDRPLANKSERKKWEFKTRVVKRFVCIIRQRENWIARTLLNCQFANGIYQLCLVHAIHLNYLINQIIANENAPIKLVNW